MAIAGNLSTAFKFPPQLQHLAGRFTKVNSLDLGSEYSSACEIELGSTEIKFHSTYTGDPNTRTGDTKEQPTVSGHIPHANDAGTALHGYAVSSAKASRREQYEIVHNLKAVLYSGPRSEAAREEQRSLAVRVPYLVERYKGTKLAQYPQFHITACYAESLVYDVDPDKEAFWVCTVPSNYTKESLQMYKMILDEAGLTDRHILYAEVECAMLGFAHDEPLLAEMENKQVGMFVDLGGSTMDFQVCMQTSRNPCRYQMLGKSDATPVGSRTILEAAESYFTETARNSGSTESPEFKSDLLRAMDEFKIRMHVFKESGLDSDDLDQRYSICNETINITSGQMQKWFDELTRHIKMFIGKKCDNYGKDPTRPHPTTIFLLGGTSQSEPVRRSFSELKRETPRLRNSNIVFGGNRSATTVSMGAILRLYYHRSEIRQSYYWFGLVVKEPSDQERHGDAPTKDVEYDELEKTNYMRCIIWSSQPNKDWFMDSEQYDNLPTVSLCESFSKFRTCWIVPTTVYVCEKATGVKNDNGKLWSYESVQNNTERIEFEIDFDPERQDPLFNKDKLPPAVKKGNGFYYEVAWTISVRATSMGLQIFCQVTSPPGNSRKLVYSGPLTLVTIMPQDLKEDDRTTGSENRNKRDRETSHLPKKQARRRKN